MQGQPCMSCGRVVRLAVSTGYQERALCADERTAVPVTADCGSRQGDHLPAAADCHTIHESFGLATGAVLANLADQ